MIIKHKGANGLKYPSVTEINDVVYDENQAEVCKLDLLFDESKLGKNGKYPVVFNIHGGGWITGDKRFRRGVCIQYAFDGNFVININYALTPKYTYRDEVQNIFSALKWMIANAEKYKFDLDRVVITGDSAGAHLSAVTIVTLSDTDWQQKFGVEPLGIKFKGAMLFCGPYDFTEFWMRFPILDTMLKGIAGIKRVKDYEKSEYVNYLNPISRINADFPRTLVITGAQDFVDLHRLHGKPAYVGEHLYPDPRAGRASRELDGRGGIAVLQKPQDMGVMGEDHSLVNGAEDMSDGVGMAEPLQSGQGSSRLVGAVQERHVYGGVLGGGDTID